MRVTDELDTKQPRQRIAYLLHEYWASDRARMANELGVSSHTLRDICRAGKAVPDEQVEAVLRKIAHHPWANPVWLRTGEGHWKRNGTMQIAMAEAEIMPVPGIPPPPQPARGPRADRLAILLEREWGGDRDRLAAAIGDDRGDLARCLDGSEEPSDELLGLALLATNDRPGAAPILEGWLYRGEGPYVAARPPMPPPPDPTPPTPPTANPFDLFLAAVRRMEANAAAVAEADRRIDDLAAGMDTVKARVQSLETGSARVPSIRDAMRAELREEVGRATAQLRREIRAGRDSDGDALSERFDRLEAAISRVTDAAASLATKLDNDRRQLARLDEWCTRLDGADGKSTDAQARAAAERALKLYQESQLAWSEWRTAGRGRDEAISRRLTEVEHRLDRAAASGNPEPPPAAEPATPVPDTPTPGAGSSRPAPGAGVDLVPRMAIIDWYESPGPHQRLIPETGRTVMGRRLSRAYREHGIPTKLTGHGKNHLMGHYTVADMQHYVRWLAATLTAELDGGPEPDIDSWLAYFAEHALPAWHDRLAAADSKHREEE